MSSYTRRRGDATCAVCGEKFTIAGDRGLVFRHGTNPFGETRAPCFGSGAPSFEQSRGQLQAWIDTLTTKRATLLARIMELEAEPFDIVAGGVVLRAGDDGYAFQRRRTLARWRQQLTELDSEISRSRLRFYEWQSRLRRSG